MQRTRRRVHDGNLRAVHSATVVRADVLLWQVTPQAMTAGGLIWQVAHRQQKSYTITPTCNESVLTQRHKTDLRSTQEGR